MSIKLYWMGGAQNETNFGDTLSPKIVEILSGRKVCFSALTSCEMIAIGSLIDKAIRGRYKRLISGNWHRPYIWGTGSFGTTIIRKNQLLNITAVRGPLTRDKMNLDASTPLGDPGLFVNQLSPPRKKLYRWGIVPHIADQQITILSEMQKETPNSCIIDLANPNIQETIDKISLCEFIASSSLHGLITADALGIPNVWLKISSNVKGGSWKFHDYFLSVERNPDNPILPNRDLRAYEQRALCPPRNIIEQRQKDLLDAFKKTGL